MSDDILKEKLFDDMDVADLLSHIFNATKAEDDVIKQTIENLMEVFTNQPEGAEDAVDYETVMGFAAPLIKDFIDISVKNKKHYIDLATVSQKFLTSKQEAQATVDSSVPWKIRKEEIIREAKETAKEIAKETDKIKHTVVKKVEDANGLTGTDQPN